MVPRAMSAVQLTGYGGLEKLVYRNDVSVPEPGPNDVLIRVTAAGVNNTDINTRTGWYNAAIETGTTEGGAAGFGVAGDGMGDWSADIELPRLQKLLAGEAGDGACRGAGGERISIARMDPREDIVLSTTDSEGELIWSTDLTAKRRDDWLLALESMELHEQESR